MLALGTCAKPGRPNYRPASPEATSGRNFGIWARILLRGGDALSSGTQKERDTLQEPECTLAPHTIDGP
jgi:hypothetical protein